MDVSKEMLKEVWDTLEWRHHGAGLLQAYLPFKKFNDPNHNGYRVHIWHRFLVKPGIEESGAKHNHRFDLLSHVLHGRLLHTRLMPDPSESGEHYLWKIIGAPRQGSCPCLCGRLDCVARRD